MTEIGRLAFLLVVVEVANGQAFRGLAGFLTNLFGRDGRRTEVSLRIVDATGLVVGGANGLQQSPAQQHQEYSSTTSTVVQKKQRSHDCFWLLAVFLSRLQRWNSLVQRVISEKEDASSCCIYIATGGGKGNNANLCARSFIWQNWNFVRLTPVMYRFFVFFSILFLLPDSVKDLFVDATVPYLYSTVG